MKRLILISLLAIAACSPQNGHDAKANKKDTAQEAPISIAAAEKDGVKIFYPRVRVAPNGMDMTAAYLTIKNDSDKEIQVTSANVSIGKSTELHTHVKGADGQMTMTQVKSFPVQAKSEFSLAPGGAHLMVFGVKNDMKAGDKAKITLGFDNGSEMTFDAVLVEDPTDTSKNEKAEHSH